MTTPIILLDVDGTISPLRGKSDWPDEMQHSLGMLVPGISHPSDLHWSPSLIARLRELHESGRAELRWLTYWGEDGNRFVAPTMGLPGDLKAYHPPQRGGWRGCEDDRCRRWYKLCFAWKAYQEGRPVVWCEDDLDNKRARRWIASLDPSTILPIQPKPFRGISPADMDSIETFVDSHLG